MYNKIDIYIFAVKAAFPWLIAISILDIIFFHVSLVRSLLYILVSKKHSFSLNITFNLSLLYFFSLNSNNIFI